MTWFMKLNVTLAKIQLKSKEYIIQIYRYLNHINLLKIIKQDILQEKIKFIERTQGAEFSLFIENIFTIESKESINNLDATTPSGLVKNVIEKKLLIEKLQDKMNQRLEILNQLLVNHAIRQNSHNINPPPLNIVKNNINLINPTFLRYLTFVIIIA